MNISPYISSLLYRYQCVTVPGFGAFITEIQSAQLQGSAVSFYPPSKVVSFNANIKNNDGLLANHVSLTEKISYEVAVNAISSQVALWLQTLNNKETLVLENIGTITLSNESTITFEPFLNTNYLTSSFGFSSFIAPSIKREELKKQIEALEETTPLVFTLEKKNNSSYLKYAASAVLFVGLIGSFAYKNYADSKAAKKTLLVEQAVQQKVQNKIQEATFFIDVPASLFNTNSNENDSKPSPYHVVAGVFSNQKNATNAYLDLIDKGFKAQLGNKNRNNMYPVYFQSFSDLNEAKTFLSNLRNTTNNQAWLLID